MRLVQAEIIIIGFLACFQRAGGISMPRAFAPVNGAMAYNCLGIHHRWIEPGDFMELGGHGHFFDHIQIVVAGATFCSRPTVIPAACILRHRSYARWRVSCCWRDCGRFYSHARQTILCLLLKNKHNETRLYVRQDNRCLSEMKRRFFRIFL